MRNFLTIGEVATLLNLTTSQIRFYEKKGLVKPHLIDSNGYRLYSYRELDILDIIITFRKFNLPITEIKAILHQKNDYNFLEILDKIEKQIDEEMMFLKSTLSSVNKLRKSYTDFKTHTDKIMHFPKRTLHIVDNDINIDKTEKELYDLVQKHDLNYSDNSYLFFTIFTDSLSINCLYDQKNPKQLANFSTYELEEGYYYCFNINITDYSEVEKIQTLFYQKCRKAGYEPIGEYIVIEDFSNFSFSRTKIHLTLQTRVKMDD
ncbi:MerR family transcriptional regulator [Amphibacillus cookii]|uniref:MerR family transcriptional regulator n=1 Tax=Amphibacillus cookii TaxID=767787 RepID=UPI00195B65C2|nr:MerR family transcriptional regulator [Amphibacillus cookii]MBM7539849.1 DNA-binding transcriptional MerR regulator [Amphibacillus cookii]